MGGLYVVFVGAVKERKDFARRTLQVVPLKGLHHVSEFFRIGDSQYNKGSMTISQLHIPHYEPVVGKTR